jgi:hypothetical protein
MIKYTLRCGEGHEFEGWFRSGADFEAQAGRALLSCAHCGSQQVAKAIMSPNVNPSDKRATVPSETQAAFGSSTAKQVVTTGMPLQLVEMVRNIHKHLRANAEDVGPRFAEEARRIHYEEVEPRGIYGQATPREAKDLHEEGIDVHALPPLPEDAN